MAKEMPTGVKVISVLYWIGADLAIIYGLIMLLGAGAITSMMPALATFGGLIVAMGVVFIGLGVLYIFTALHLWKGKNWARIVVLVLQFLEIL